MNETWFLTGPDRGRAFLKIDAGSLNDLHATAAVVDKLRSRGYPTPRWLFVGQIESGHTYHVQEVVPGELAPLGAPATTLGKQLIELVEFNAGFDPRPDRDVSSFVVSHFAACLADLRRAAPGLRPVVDRYAQLADRLGLTELPSGEFVHGDFHFYNVLVRNGRVSAVIDVEACGSGTRAIDYGRLLRDTYFGADGNHDVRTMIKRAGEAVAGPEVLAFCTAAAAIDNLHWRVHHRPIKIPSMLPGFERLAIDLAQSFA
ncbi:phosphotransferase [Kribbella swartbergensis]